MSEVAKPLFVLVLVALVAFFLLPEAAWTALLVFAGCLLAVFLRSGAALLRRWMPIPERAAVGVVIFVLFALFVAGTSFFGMRVARQAGQIADHLSELAAELQQDMKRDTPFGRAARFVLDGDTFSGLAGAGAGGSGGAEGAGGAGSTPGAGGEAGDAPASAGAAAEGGGGSATGAGAPAGESAGSAAGGGGSGPQAILARAGRVLFEIAVILFVGIYGALEPDTYRSGVIRLFPPERRARVARTLSDLAGTLRWWLTGKLLSMAVVGVLTTAGLLALGAPLPLGLGVLAGLLAFVPNIGPTLALVPAALLALSEGPTMAAWVIGLYLGVQAVESYVITPLIQERTVYLPPAMIIGGQFFLWLNAGTLGLFVATPLLATGLFLVRRLWIEDRLERGSAPA